MGQGLRLCQKLGGAEGAGWLGWAGREYGGPCLGRPPPDQQ